MRNLSLISTIVVASSALAIGCSECDILQITSQNQEINSPTRSSSFGQKATTVHKQLSKEELFDVLNERFNLKRTRSNDYSIETISENNKTLLYVVNLSSGGWAIVAGDVRDENQILAYGDSGTFVPENIDNPGIKFWYEATVEQMKAVEYEDSNYSSISTASISYDEPYLWVRRSLGTCKTKYDSGVDHLIQTKWGQERPWNYKTPQGCPTGCLSVAVSQMLYYLHHKTGVPDGLYHQIEPSYNFVLHYNPNKGYYALNVSRSAYVSNSPRWSQMATEAEDSLRTIYTDYVGDLMIDVGGYLGMRYGSNGSGVDDDPQVFSHYGLKCDTHSYDFELVAESLNKGLPVIVLGLIDNTDLGHVWIIDGYSDYTTITDSQYKWVLMPPDSLQYHFQYEKDIDIDHIFTEEEKQRYYPDLVEDQIVHEYHYSYGKYLKMNWGFDGSGDDGNFSIAPSDDWTADNINFYKSDVQIYYNFRPLQQ